jgi:hypothetical protein
LFAVLAAAFPARAMRGVCRPASGGQVLAPAYKPPARKPACTDGDLDEFYSACVAEGGTDATCGVWASGHQGCDACLVTTAFASEWGAFVRMGADVLLINGPGCVALASQEGGNTAGCAAAKWDLAACQHVKCGGDAHNPNDVWNQACATCFEESVAGGGACRQAAEAVEARCGASSSSFDEACALGARASFDVRVKTIAKLFCAGAAPQSPAPVPSGSEEGSAPDPAAQTPAQEISDPKPGAGDSTTAEDVTGDLRLPAGCGCRTQAASTPDTISWPLVPLAAFWWRRRCRR